MSTHINILIDGSGCMGYMKGAGEEHENKYLIDETHTRTDLVKKILTEHLVPKLGFSNHIIINSFSNKKKIDANGKPVIKNDKYIEYPGLSLHYSGVFEKDKILQSINEIENPPIGGTPLRWAILYLLNKASQTDNHIIVFSDGDGYIDGHTDTEWHTIITAKAKQLNKNVKIHIVGIAQNDITQSKSKHLCALTKGVYINLKAMNYEDDLLNNLFFSLKSNITSSAIQSNIEPQIAKTPPIKSQEIKKVKQENKNSPNEIEEKINIEVQVLKNTKSITLISNQLDNILRLLQSQKLPQDEDISYVYENEVHNKRVGRLAEKYLYQELLKNNWEKVEWLNKEKEQYLPYDFIISDKGNTFYYECKGTSSDVNEFQLTRDEWECYLINKGNYRVCFVSNVDSSPTYVRFMDLLDDMKQGKIIPCPAINKAVKANRIIFQVLFI